MKHCAKKLLGLAFALALCLAVGGTAFAVEAPEFADVPAALPEQEMLAFEPNVAAEPGTNTTGNLERDGYQVTIPTTVTVKSGEDKETLKVTADVRQMRTLTITLDSTNNWQLKHESGQVLAGYSLTSAGGGYTDGGNMWYQEEDTTGGKKKLKLHLQVGQKAQGDFDVNWKDRFTIPLTVAVDPSQATMSGTYSDTVSFAFAFTHKSCVTYFINVYEQELQLTNSGAHVQAVNMVNADGTVKPGAEPVRTEIWEYPVGNDVNHEWSYGGNESDAELRWEKATATMNTAQDEAAGKLDANKNVTINLNLVRKQYWLDVNGATDYMNEYADGNQGNKIAGFVNIKVSVDNGMHWSSWFWQEPGDDYWGKFPYGIQFKLGFHHVKNGYVYDTGPGLGVKIIANKQATETKLGQQEGNTTYYVYEGTLTGEPTGTDSYNNVRYCYIPCYKKGITYFANGGTGGTESVNEDNPPRSNVLYDVNGKLKTPEDEDLDIHAPTGKSFAGWSTKPTYTTGDKLYQPGDNVSDVNWDGVYEGKHLSERPNYHGAQDTQKRELYAIWKTPYTVKVQFGREYGWTDWDEVSQSFPESKQRNDLFYSAETLGGKAYAYGDTSLTLSATENKTVWDALQAKIAKKTSDIGSYDRPEDVWQLKNEYTFTTLPANGEVTIQIKRKRYLLNVIPALQNATGGYTPASDATEAELYGIFDLKSCDVLQTPGGGVSYYQSMRSYGGSYKIYNVKAKPGYQFVGFKVPSVSGPLTSTDGTGNLTGKNTGIYYFGGDNTTYKGDTIYVMYKKDMVTFDFNGGKNQAGETKTEMEYDPDSFISVMYLRKDGSTASFKGWSVNKTEEPDETIYHANDTQLKNIRWPDSTNRVLYARWSTGPNRAPAKKVLTVRYHANFDPNEELALDLDPNPLLDDMDEDFGFEPDPLPEDVLDPTVDEVKTVTYKPDENVVLRHCMFKRAGYVFVGWNTEPDGKGKNYDVNGVPITDWAADATVDLYAQWEKPHHLKPVVDGEPQPGGATPAPTPQPGGADATPAPQPGGVDDAFGIDPHLGGMDDAFGVDPADQPEGMDDAFGVDPADQPKALDDAFGVDPDPQPEELDDAFGV